MSNTIEKLDRLPDAALNQLSDNIENPENLKSSESSGIGVVGENEAMQGAKHTALNGFDDLAANAGQSQAPAVENPVNTPAISQAAGTKQPVAIGTLFNGKAGIELVDMLFPALIILIADNVLGYAIDKKDLQLTAAEKNTIAPFMQSYLDSVNVHMSPLGALIAVMSGVYAAKFMEAFPNIKKKAKTKQESAQPSTKMTAVVKNLENINEKLEKSLSNAEQRKQYGIFLLPMQYDKAIQHIKTSKRMNINEAKRWYKNNVEPLKIKN
jgi:hypothetical protein